MPIAVTCEQCGFQREFPDAAAGAQTVCTQCQAPLVVPDAPLPPPTPTGARRGDVWEGTKDLIWVHGRATIREEHIARQESGRRSKKRPRGRLAERETMPMVPPPPPSDGSGACPSCGAAVLSRARFCTVCGYNLTGR